MGEFVPGYEASTWYGVGVPKNTPAEIVDKLNKEINALPRPIPKSRRGLPNSVPTCLRARPLNFAKLITDETEKWGKVVKFVGIKAD